MIQTEVRCFLRKGQGAIRRGLWAMVDGHLGNFYHGDHNTIDNPRYTIEELQSDPEYCEEVTPLEALGELSNWPQGVATLCELFSKFPSKIKKQGVVGYSFEQLSEMLGLSIAGVSVVSLHLDPSFSGVKFLLEGEGLPECCRANKESALMDVTQILEEIKMNQPEKFEAVYQVEAMRWTGDNVDAVKRFCGDVQTKEDVPDLGSAIQLKGQKGEGSAGAVGSWIVKFANVTKIVSEKEFKASYRKPGPRSALV